MSFKKISIAIVFLVFLNSAMGFVGLRAGMGQFVPADSTIKDSYANAFMADIRYNISQPLFVTLGAKFYNVHSTELPVEVVGSDICVGSYKHRVDAFGVFAGIGIGKFMGDAGTGIFPYATAAAGFISPVVSQVVEYYHGCDTTYTYGYVEEERKWSFMVNPHAGIEVRMFGIGIFVQGDYFWATEVEYNEIEIDDTEIFSGGYLKPSGWAVYLGIVID